MINNFKLYNGDCLQLLNNIENESIQCCITSPPYFGLRSYLDKENINKNLEIGSENNYEEYIQKLTEIFIIIKNKLKKNGTLWINIGDSYEKYKKEIHKKDNFNKIKPKDLMGIPWKLATSLSEPYYNGKIKNESDRIWIATIIDLIGNINFENLNISIETKDENILNKANQLIYNDIMFLQEIFPYLISKKKEIKKFFNDIDIPLCYDQGYYLRQDIIWAKSYSGNITGGATMPEKVMDRCTKSHEYLFLFSKNQKYYFDYKSIQEDAAESTIERDKYKRTIKKDLIDNKRNNICNKYGEYRNSNGKRNRRSVWILSKSNYSGNHFATMPEKMVETCILAGSKIGDTILDPFSGIGTTGKVALKLNRNYIGIELNEEYYKKSEIELKKSNINLF